MKTWKLWSLGIFWITAASCGGTSNLLSALKVCRVGVEATCGPGKQCVPSGELGEGVCQPVGFALCTHAQVSCGAKCCNNTTEFCDEESNTCQSKICGVGQRVCGTQCCQALPLTLTGFSPSEGGYDTLLSLQGTGFSTLPSENSVTLGKIQIPAAHILSATPTQLEVKVPKNTLCSGLIQVTVGDKTTTSSTPFAYLLTATVSTLAGNSAYGHVEATGELAQFRLPEGMSIDAQGTLYVADNENHRIRKVTPGGGVSTLAGGAIGA
ncbi:MAG: IPT/TIG domain-containing protein, partial [Proteobacteria bacterium]|nr:IPT/TIG domain-containing protein [Pseudomonadota bacterium]